MTEIPLSGVVTAIATTLLDAQGVKQSLDPAHMKESIPDLPMLQVYPEAFESSTNSNTDRVAFRGGVRHLTMTVNVDAYCRQRSHIGEDLAKVMNIADAIIVELNKQNVAPYFHHDAIKAFSWTAERVTFVYGAEETKYAGIRFVLSIHVY